jgi:hypothetical protein
MVEEWNPSGSRFSAPFQTGPEFTSLPYNGYWLIPRLGRGIDHLPQSSTEVKEIIELYLYSPSVPSQWVIE